MDKSKVPGLITILIMTLITSVMWIAFSVYRAFVTKPAPNVPPQVLQSLSPTLDKTTVDKIQGRLYFNESAIPEPSIGPAATITPAPTLAPTLTPAPSASASATPSATPTLTPTPT